MSIRAKRGNFAERLARTHLEGAGLKFAEANFQCRFGEIDLIMWDSAELVFIEVRSRSSREYLHPFESIDHHKQQRLRRTAQLYLQRRFGRRENIEPCCRFDVVSILSCESFGNVKNELEWIEGAF